MDKGRLAAVAGCAALLAACSDGDTDGACWSVVGNQAFGLECNAPAPDPTQVLEIGHLDVSLADSYVMFLLVDAGDGDTCGGGEPITLRGIDVDVELPAGFLDAIDDPAVRAEVEQNLSTSHLVSSPREGMSTVDVELLSGLMTALDSGDVLGDAELVVAIVNLVLHGDRDGREIDTSLRYPIELCSGCSKIDLGPCDALPDDYVPQTPCNPGQDSTVDCCTLPGGGQTCPPPLPVETRLR